MLGVLLHGVFSITSQYTLKTGCYSRDCLRLSRFRAGLCLHALVVHLVDSLPLVLAVQSIHVGIERLA